MSSLDKSQNPYYKDYLPYVQAKTGLSIDGAKALIDEAVEAHRVRWDHIADIIDELIREHDDIKQFLARFPPTADMFNVEAAPWKSSE